MNNIIEFPPKKRATPWVMAPNRAEIDNLHSEILLLAQEVTDIKSASVYLHEEVTTLSKLVNKLLYELKKKK